MPFSYAVTTASAGAHLVNLSFPYLSRVDVHVTVNDNELDQGALVWNSGTQIDIATANGGNLAGGERVKVYRRTPADQPRVVFASGNLTHADLNAANLQLLYIVQEAFDVALDAGELSETVAEQAAAIATYYSEITTIYDAIVVIHDELVDLHLTGTRTLLNAPGEFWCVDYPLPGGTGGGGGTGTELDPWVGVGFALAAILRTLDTGGFGVTLYVDSDLTTSNSVGYYAVDVGCVPLVGGGSLTVEMTAGHQVTCGEVTVDDVTFQIGGGISCSSYNFTTFRGFKFRLSDPDDAFAIFDQVASLGIMFLEDFDFGEAALGDQITILSNSEVRIDEGGGSTILSGGGRHFVNNDQGGAFYSFSNYSIPADIHYDNALLDDTTFVHATTSSITDFNTGTFTGVGTVFGKKYIGTTGATINSTEGLPGDEDGTLDQTSSYNGDFGGGGGGGAVDSVNGHTGVVTLDAGDIPFTPAVWLASTDVQAALAELAGGGALVIETGNGPYTVAADTAILVLNRGSPGASAVTLGTVAARNKLPLYIFDWAGNAGDITITPNGSETIMLAATWKLGSNADKKAAARFIPSTGLSGWLAGA